MTVAHVKKLGIRLFFYLIIGAGFGLHGGLLLFITQEEAGNLLKFKVWKGASEPAAWGLSGNDTTAALQSGSGVGIWTYLSASTTNMAIVASLDNFSAKTTN